MSRPFFQATAEQVVTVSEAVVALGGGEVAEIATYTDLPPSTVGVALKLATDVELLTEKDGVFSSASPLCKLLRTPQDREKVAILRVMIESYDPFLVFREELEATNDVTVAAQRTTARLELDCHREEVKQTLLSLATYSGALTGGHGANYERDASDISTLLDELAAGAQEIAGATQTIREKLGRNAAGQVDDEQVIRHLADGLRHAIADAGREAVLQGGVAVENFLTSISAHYGTNIANAHGINAIMSCLVQAGHYPTKLQNVCRYLGHVRNAADHGTDNDIGAPWDVSALTGRNYIFVAVAFIHSMVAHSARHHEI